MATFYHLLARPDKKVRVCTGLSCRMAGADDMLRGAELSGLPVEATSCLAGCDVAPAVLQDRRVLPQVTIEDVHECGGDWERLRSAANADDAPWTGHVGPERDDPDRLALNLHGEPDFSGAAFARAQQMGSEGVISAIESSVSAIASEPTSTFWPISRPGLRAGRPASAGVRSRICSSMWGCRFPSAIAGCPADRQGSYQTALSVVENNLAGPVRVWRRPADF